MADEMQQHSTSLWNATSSSPRFDPLRGEIEVDVAVIGAGITGVTAALLLAERGRTVALLEKETIGGGETGNTTAHITVSVDARYHYLRRTYSSDEAKLVGDAMRASMSMIESLVDRFRINCHFRRVPGYLYTEKRKKVAELKSEAAAAREAGFDVSWIDAVPLPFETRGAVLWPDQAQFHPGEYLSALSMHASSAGVKIFEKTHVTSVEDGKPCIVECEGGRVRARSVFMATNVPISGFTLVHTKQAAYRTYAMAFDAQPGHPEGLFWDTADPYHYTRWQETAEGDFLIVGGFDHKVGEEEDTEGCFEKLAAYTHEQFGPHQLRYRWSGQVAEPHGGLPMMGGTGNLYISTGYAGQGMTFGTVGAMLITDLITGVENPWAAVFDHKRVHGHMTAREFVTENAPFPAHLISDRLTNLDVEGKDTLDLRAGEGKILSLKGRKVAAYRDDSGKLHCVSSVCTHMKCDVSWNPAEVTWDCPCHGSRFKTDGSVLNGPANDPLEKIDVEKIGE